MRKIRAQVLQEDIDKANSALGKFGFMRAMQCPVAQAINRINPCPGYEFVHVSEDDIMWERGSTITYSLLPTVVGDAILEWDGGGYMVPFEFDLEVPC